MIGSIYMIYYKVNTDICYIGSTTNTVNQRFAIHKELYKQWLNGGKFNISIYPYFSDLGVDNFKIKLLKEYEVVDSTHLRVYEQLWLTKFKTVNINNPFRIKVLSRKQYYQKNKDKFNDYYKDYYLLHKDELNDYGKDYYKENKEKLKEYQNYYRENHKDYYKEYRKRYYEDNKYKFKEQYEENKDKLSDYRKSYYEMNKYKFKEYYEENKDKAKENSKKYYKEHKDKAKEYYEENKDQIKNYSKEYHKKNENKFSCLLCNFNASQICNYKKHLESKKHVLNAGK
jgi:hypothetical protein